MLSRKDLLRGSLFSLGGVSLVRAQEVPKATEELTEADLIAAERLDGIQYTAEERKPLLAEAKAYLRGYRRVRQEPIRWQTGTPVHFETLAGGSQPGSRVDVRVGGARRRSLRGLSEADLMYASLAELSHWLRSGQISSRELTEVSLRRLKRYGPELLCVVTLTEELARAQAAQADRERERGRVRGPLHGIPFGLKDLFATKEIRTTWGANPYRDQVFDLNAAVTDRLREAGAVLVAKLSMGALALGDVWFEGTTKNPWNPKQGSSGSSAGSGAAVAAGLLPFAIGTETLGSIMSPSLRCRVTGLRPTFGRVSRYGAMELSYSMDKVGPLCHEVEDCALVLGAISGEDGRDPASVSRPFRYRRPRDLKGFKVGYTSDVKPDDPMLARLRAAGASVREVKFTPVPDGVLNILDVECGSAFDEFTRSEAIRNLGDSPWPATFRASRYVPAVEYLQAQRARRIVMERFELELGNLDAFLSNGIAPTIVHTNLTGHPQILLPTGGDEKGNSLGRSLTGRLFGEERLLQVARSAQGESPYASVRPSGFA